MHPPRSATADHASIPSAAGPPTDATTADPARTPAETIRAAEPRNIALLSLYQIICRTGWIFKTESVLMPAFLDLAAGGRAGWLRGCLPVLNRFGMSVPPLYYARRLESLSKKKIALATTSLSMSLPFAILAGLTWFGLIHDSPAWLPYVYLLLYTLFCSVNGMNLLTLGTLQGKLVRAERRGKLLSISSSLGTVTAVAAAAWLLPGWLQRPDGGFDYIFGFTAVCFAGSVICVASLVEPGDARAAPRVSLADSFRDAFHLFRRDGNFRRLALVSCLFSTMVILFPHYQAFGRGRFGAPVESMMLWVVVQNVGTGLASLVAGPIADARGNRSALRGLLVGTALAPLTPALLAYFEPPNATAWYTLVFLFVGLTPVSQRVMANYTLEISQPADHPRYLSTINLFQAIPFVFSPLVGLLIDVVGFEAVFLAGGLVLLLAAVMTVRMVEPRHGIEWVTDLQAAGDTEV